MNLNEAIRIVKGDILDQEHLSRGNYVHESPDDLRRKADAYLALAKRHEYVAAMKNHDFRRELGNQITVK